MAKHLRIDIAEMTDIGRRRANNQDNVAKNVPDDQREIDRAGALVVVADGMGGHAAGEIASTVAVETITTAYTESFDDDVMDALETAVRRANDRVFTISRENADHMGMGTTVVAAVIYQGLLFIANIGDSRCYLIRNGVLRQVTRDHSWVAEQVRAGVLTEDQARVHVHRNVITRSLGTQPDVLADFFIEPLREGDLVILCSDGLHGYVDDASLLDIASHHAPHDAVRLLVEAANEAGGPDNITVAIAQINETPIAPTVLLEKLQKLDHQRSETTPLQVSSSAKKRGDVTFAPIPPPLVAESPPSISSRSMASRLRVAAIIIIALSLLAVSSYVGWTYAVGPYTQSRYTAARVTTDIAKVKQDINRLQSSQPSPASPADELALLATDQQLLNSDLGLSNLTASQRQGIEMVLVQQLAPATQQALEAYNGQAHIIPLTNVAVDHYSLQCDTAAAAPLVVLQNTLQPGGGGALPTYFIRDVAGHVRPLLITPAIISCQPALANNLSVIDMVSAGDHLVVLTSATDSTNIPQVQTLGSDGVLKPLASVKAFDANLTPTHVAVAPNGATLAVLGHGTTDTIYVLSGTTFATAIAIPLQQQTSQHVLSMAIGSNNLLYLLLDNGDLATVGIDGTNFHIVSALDIPPALPVGDPQQYTNQTPVPTVPTATGNASASHGVFVAAPTATPAPTVTPAPTPYPTPLPRSGSSTPLTTAIALTVSNAPVPTVAIADPSGHRVIVLQSNGGVDLDLQQQYTDPNQLNSQIGVALTPDGKSLLVLLETQMLNIHLPTNP